MIAILPEQQGVTDLGGTMRLGNYPITIKKNTLAMQIYGQTEITERHRHRYEVNPVYLHELEKAGLVFSGSWKNRMEICEVADHPFFLTTQFHPEFRSRPTRPSPPFIGFVKACSGGRAGR